MHRLRRLAIAVVAATAAVVFTGPAAADQPEIFGPFEYHVGYSFSNCGFQAVVSIDGTFTNRAFVNPVRNINYFREEGTVTNPSTGTTLEIKNSWTELGTPPTNPDEGQGLFTQRGVVTHIVAPGGGRVLIDAGRLVYRYPDGLVFEVHGNHQFAIEGDLSDLCAALAA